MAASRPASRIIFDLDGTLVQTRVASWALFEQVNKEFDLGIDEEAKYFKLLNGNLFEQIRRLCDSTEKADAAIESFMGKLGSEYFPAMIPGMVDVIHALAPVSTLAVLSSNLTSVIRRVLTDNGIEFCFAHVFGGDVEPDKSVGISRFVADAARGTGRRCSPFYDEGAPAATLAEDQTVLVTDTVGDVEAAIAAGIRSVGVSWGMHSAAQLIAAGVEFVAFWPQELVSYLRVAHDKSELVESCSTVLPAEGVSPRDLSSAIRRGRRLLALERSSVSDSCGCDVVAATPSHSATALSTLGRTRQASPRLSEDVLDAVTRILN